MPLANDARPTSFDEMVGQTHLIDNRHGELAHMARTGNLRSCIFFGPPGCGKTTAAEILASSCDLPIVRLNATRCSVRDIQDAAKANPDGVLIYLDEIQYFNKKQQQSLLSYVEDGSVTLIASTTENPYHHVYKALLSRCSPVLEFKPVPVADIARRLETVCDTSEPPIAHGATGIVDGGLDAIARFAQGDMRSALNFLELARDVYALDAPNPPTVTCEMLSELAPSSLNRASFDANGDMHYRYKSALQKSIRGSDPDAAVFWLNQLLEGGDIVSPIRRMLVIAYEDIGLADPFAATIMLDAANAAERLGLPEARYPLSFAAIYLALAPKSNSVGEAFSAAVDDIHQGYGIEVPEHIAEECPREGYLYPHAYPNHWVAQAYLPPDMASHVFYHPGTNTFEQTLTRYWAQVKGQGVSDG